MDDTWRSRTWGQLVSTRRVVLLIGVLCCCCGGGAAVANENKSGLDGALRRYVDSVLSVDRYSVIPGIGIERSDNVSFGEGGERHGVSSRSLRTLEDYVHDRLEEFTNSHVLTVNVPATARYLTGSAETGRSSFLTGFGMGFLAFGLKKLLLPVIIGAQLIKSVLLAMFLPSIIGSLGKILGKGLSSVTGLSSGSAGGLGGLGGLSSNQQQQQQPALEDFEFKDTSPYVNDDGEMAQDFQAADPLSLNVAQSTTEATSSNSRFGIANQRVSFMGPNHNDNYYLRKPAVKKTDYKVFHKIPTSSLLLTSYDPFYSPLLSRLDAVFQQLGLGATKSPETEKCRERLVCMMYANPAKYAPYSNLVSAQLSRELNELRKPASDNPEILRFFRYMKAAKDGQDGEECLAHGGCPSLNANQPSPAIVTTFNDINKLVQARKLA